MSAPAVPQSPTDPSTLAPARTLRVGIAGLGRAGAAHAIMLAATRGCELAGVADPRGGARAGLRGMGFTVPAFPRVERLLEKASPDAVFVCTAQHERARVATAVLEAGIPVLVERPMARTLAEAEALVGLAAAKGVPLAVGHPLAFEPVFARMHEAVHAGALGAVVQARSAMFVSRVFAPHPRRGPGRLDPRRVAGGVVAHLASDLLFVLVHMLGAPVEVRATWNLIYGAVEDELHGMMKLGDGTEVGFDCSWSVPGYQRASTVIEIEGRDGRLLASDEALELELQRPAAGFRSGSTRLREAEFESPARFDFGGEALYVQDAAFLRWVAGGAVPPNAAFRAFAAQVVMDALYRSAAAGGADVKVT